MIETKRMTSIARRFSRREFWGRFADYLSMNIVLFLIILLGFCYFSERNVLGDAWTLSLHRTAGWTPSTDFWHSLATVEYRFNLPDQPVTTVAMGSFIQTVLVFSVPLIVIQFISLIGIACTSTRKARKLLEPLNQMAATTQYLTQSRFDESKFQDLENAIARISPTGPEATLSTGDRDLQGLEGAVNNLLTRMRDAYRQQARFVSDASHELRTPIAVIQGYANMLDRWGKEDETILEESIAAIKGEADQMKMLVEQLLFLARGDSGKTKPNFVPFSLNDMMREVYEESCMIDEKHKWEFCENGEVFAHGDTGLLKQTARILVDNAAKYSPEQECITLRIGQNSGGEAWFSVQDNGIGIPAEDMPHVFERFFRADPARTRQTGGTGLGLSIAKWIIDRHGGHFELLSREDLGTRITVCLPTPPQKDE